MRIAFARLNGRDGHTVGRELLAQLCGGEVPEIAVTELGKPYFVDKKLHFSISHTKNHAFCCLSENNIGLDAEEMDRRVDSQQQAKGQWQTPVCARFPRSLKSHPLHQLFCVYG